MSFVPKDFHDLALWLASQRADESSRRTAISRIYYAVHLTARERLLERGWLTPTGKGDDHARVIRELRTRRFRDRGDQLRYLRELREHSDYHVSAVHGVLNENCELCDKVRKSAGVEVVNQEHCREALEVGRRLLAFLERL
jgi:hypothetical protein